MEPDELWLVAPKEFVAARNGLVRELRKAGARDVAADVATWRRPSAVDWALNVAVREHPDQAEQFLDAVDAARSAQAGAAPGTGADLRAAIADLRRAEAALTAVATDVTRRAGDGPDQRAAIATRLRTLAGDPDGVELLRQGRLTEGAPVPADDGETAVAPPARRAAKATRPAKAARERAAPALRTGSDRGAERAEDQAEVRAAERVRARLERARQAATDAEASARDAIDAERQAGAELEASSDRVQHGEVELERLRAEVAEARRALERAQRRHQTTAKAAAAATKAATQAAKALADLEAAAPP